MAEREEVEILERGNVYFFYRPRVETEEPEGRGDVQNLYLVLSPHGKDRYRLAIVGREKLPDPAHRGRQRHWGFVATVTSDPREIADELGGETYETRTRGERHQPSARPLGEGAYQVVRHDDHTHLVYGLRLPDEPGDVQETLHVEKEASYLLSIRNPETPSPPRAGLSPKKAADYPKALMERFHGRRFGEADPPDFLDHEGAEFVLISASEDVKEELGIDISEEAERTSSARVFRDLRIQKSEHPPAPLFEGRWD